MRIDSRSTLPILNRAEVMDGKVIWEYYPLRNGFCRPDLKTYLQRKHYGAMSALASSLPYEHITDDLKSARIVGHGTLKVDGDNVSCLILVATYVPEKSPGWGDFVQTASIIYWIDSTTKIIVQQADQIGLKSRGRNRTDTYTTALLRYRLNPNLPESRFVFKPPQGATERPCIALGSGGGTD
jgi:outer membrane lipoprotein-sorting protein